VKNLQDSFPLYAEGCSVVSLRRYFLALRQSKRSLVLNQLLVQTKQELAQENIGANLQHYNPVIDEAVAAEWSIPANWNLRAQMVIGSIEAPDLNQPLSK
jgi:predicted oxidoreductase (fatty acid repression mutant protein)